MAMSLEKMNEKLEKILKDLDKAIEDRDTAKVEKAVKSARDFNGKSEGQVNDVILSMLETKIQTITEEINGDEDLEADELEGLSDVRKVIMSGKDPFEKTKAVVDSLSKKGVNQEDLKNYKETQKNDNLAQIVGLQETNRELAIRISNIEMRYMEKIENNEAIIEIIGDIKKQKDKLDRLDSSMDQAKVNSTKANIKAKISELSSKGVDVSSIQNFESNPSVIDSFCATKKGELETESDTLAAKIGTDQSIPDDFKAQYGLDTVKDAKELKDKYKEMVGTRQKNASKITTLTAENRQIDKTIQTLEKEQQIANMLYDENGNLKDDTELGTEVLTNNRRIRNEIEAEMDDKFGGGFFKRFGARMDYFKSTENVGSIGAFWRALRTKTANIKQITSTAKAAQIGRDIANNNVNNMTRRQNEFKETIRREAAKQMSKNAKLTEKDITNDVMSKAYESASKDER